jgi:hypothetical protein
MRHSLMTDRFGGSARDGGLPGVWWLSPAGAVALVVPGTLLLAWRLSDATFRDSYRTPKWFNGGTVALLSSGALAFVLGSMVPLIRRRAGPRSGSATFTDEQWARVERAANLLFWLTILGYAAFVVSGMRNGVTPGEISQVFAEQRNNTGELKRQFATITGVTTFTQFGMAYVVVAVLLLRQRPDRRQGRRLATVLGLGLVRAFLLTERLAILELVVPAVAVVAMDLSARGSAPTRRIVRLAPVLLIPVVIVVFGLFEYSRSWVYYSANTPQSYGRFTVSRLAGYYVTAYNNGEIALRFERHPGRVPYASLQAVWTAPGVEQLDGYAILAGRVEAAQERVEPKIVLRQYGNPEFNSPSGLAIPFVDYGTAGGLVFLFVTGTAIGAVYQRRQEGRITAVILYPVLATGLFELPRLLYWTLGRATPSIVALLAVGWWARGGAAQVRSPAVSDRALSDCAVSDRVEP